MLTKYEDVAQKILGDLAIFKGFYSEDYYIEFEERISTMKERIRESKKEERLLKIGIVGEVKAGKSSFLNALIFDGEDILPKASTPMTAALTKISYSEKQQAKIVFYSEKDWGKIEELSHKYDAQFNDFYNQYTLNQKKRCNKKNEEVSLISREEKKKEFERTISVSLKACKELTEMVSRTAININEYLNKERIVSDISDIQGGLQDYIGVDGKYTPIVKNVELQMNNELLRGAEIVDTPGLDDPIVSRGEKTKRFLRNCDVVFLLSYCGQFLTQTDINFMCQTLPKEGIRDVVIVGSKFDSGILDDNRSESYITAVNNSASIYRKQASDNIEKCLSDGHNIEGIRRIKESLPPSFVSSIFYSCAVKRKENISYSAQEAHIIKRFKERFRDFEEKCEIMSSISGIKHIMKEKLIPIKKRKSEIIEERNREILKDNKSILMGLLEDINIQAGDNRRKLETYDKDQLEKKLEGLQNKLNTMRREIKNIFDDCAVEASRFLNSMKVSIDSEIDNYVDFAVTSKTTTETRSYREGFLGLIHRHHTYEVTSHYASVSDVISNLRGYLTRCKKMSNEEFEKIINIRKLKEMVKGAVIGAFDLSGRDFNENDILVPLEIVIKQIQIPHIDIELGEFEPMIIDAFSDASVRDEDIQMLKLQENRTLEAIAVRVKKEIDLCENKVRNVMAEQSANFVDNVIKQLTDNIENVKKQIDDKEHAIQQYIVLCETIAEHKKMLMGMEM